MYFAAITHSLQVSICIVDFPVSIKISNMVAVDERITNGIFFPQWFDTEILPNVILFVVVTKQMDVGFKR